MRSEVDRRSQICNNVDIAQMVSREPLHFIQQTISDFNGNYGADYDVTAVAADIYMR
mgnify:FL=1